MTAPERPTREQVDAALAEATRWDAVGRGVAAARANSILAAEVHALRAEASARRTLHSDQCCELACIGGACEGCRCCAAGWCVTGTDGLPEDADELARWIEVAAEPQHNHLSRGVYGGCPACGTDWDLSAPLPVVPDGPTPEAYAAASRALDVWHTRRHEALRLLRDYDTAKALRTVDVWVEQIVGVLDAPIPSAPAVPDGDVS